MTIKTQLPSTLSLLFFVNDKIYICSSTQSLEWNLWLCTQEHWDTLMCSAVQNPECLLSSMSSLSLDLWPSIWHCPRHFFGFANFRFLLVLSLWPFPWPVASQILKSHSCNWGTNKQNMDGALTELSLSRQNIEPHASRFCQETMLQSLRGGRRGTENCESWWQHVKSS